MNFFICSTPYQHISRQCKSPFYGMSLKYPINIVNNSKEFLSIFCFTSNKPENLMLSTVFISDCLMLRIPFKTNSFKPLSVQSVNN